MRAAAVTGLAVEASIARRAGIIAQPSGGIAAQTTAIAEKLLSEGAEALLSFGIAGALAPALKPGDLLVPRAVIDESGRRYTVGAEWRRQIAEALRRAGLRIDEGDMLGAREAASSPARKTELLRITGAAAIDLESHLVAQAAARAGRPFLVLRAVSDRATQALPHAAVHGLAANGKPALGSVLRSVARDPLQLLALIKLAGDTRRALDALGSALRAISLAGGAP
jgi:adenosylhomocysteine nucleosidase